MTHVHQRSHSATVAAIGGGVAMAALAIAVATTRHPRGLTEPPEGIVHGSAAVAKATPTASSMAGARGIGVAAASPQVIEKVETALAELAVLDTSDTAGRDRLEHELTSLLTPENAASIAQGLSADAMRTDFGTAVLERWLGSDAPRAATWVAAHGDLRPEQAWALGASTSQSRDCLAVLDAALDGSPLRVAVISGACAALADTDPAYAAALAVGLPEGDNRTSVLQTIVYSWMLRDPVAAERYITAIDNAAVRELLSASAAKAVAATDPDLGAAWLAGLVGDHRLSSDATLTIVDAWSARNPADAAAWVAAFAPGEVRSAAIDTTLAHWRDVDGTAAAAWLHQLPDREAVVGRMAAARAERDRPKD